MESIQINLGSDKKKRNKSFSFTKFMMEKEEAPYDFIINVKKNENPSSLSTNDIRD